jgi:sarcosine oxidase, subunit delta
MLLLPCPWCGPRPENEFRYGGQAGLKRPVDPAAVDDGNWAAYLWVRDNPKGRHTERWRHLHGCGRFFNVVRDTVTDRIISGARPGEGTA